MVTSVLTNRNLDPALHAARHVSKFLPVGSDRRRLERRGLVQISILRYSETTKTEIVRAGGAGGETLG